MLPTFKPFGQAFRDQNRTHIPTIYDQLATQPPMIASLGPLGPWGAGAANTLKIRQSEGGRVPAEASHVQFLALFRG
jgi:hypothetical protein